MSMKKLLAKTIAMTMLTVVALPNAAALSTAYDTPASAEMVLVEISLPLSGSSTEYNAAYGHRMCGSVSAFDILSYCGQHTYLHGVEGDNFTIQAAMYAPVLGGSVNHTGATATGYYTYVCLFPPAEEALLLGAEPECTLKWEGTFSIGQRLNFFGKADLLAGQWAVGVRTPVDP